MSTPAIALQPSLMPRDEPFGDASPDDIPTHDADDFELETAIAVMRDDHNASTTNGTSELESPIYTPWNVFAKRLFGSLCSTNSVVVVAPQRSLDVLLDADGPVKPSEDDADQGRDVPDQDIEMQGVRTPPPAPRRSTRYGGAVLSYYESPATPKQDTSASAVTYRKSRIPDFTVILGTRSLAAGGTFLRRNRVLALIEIKAPCALIVLDWTFQQAFRQLYDQCRHLISGAAIFSTHQGIQKIGAIAVVGKYWSYTEFIAGDIKPLGSPQSIRDAPYSPSQEKAEGSDVSWPSRLFTRYSRSKDYLAVFGADGRPSVVSMRAGNAIAGSLKDANSDMFTVN